MVITITIGGCVGESPCPERCKLENLGVNCKEVWSLLSESLVEEE